MKDCAFEPPHITTCGHCGRTWKTIKDDPHCPFCRIAELENRKVTDEQIKAEYERVNAAHGWASRWRYADFAAGYRAALQEHVE